MINIIRHRLQILSAKSKLVLLMLSDMTMAMIAWVVFGPPLINFIATEFKYSILSTIFNQFFQFLIPALSALFFMWFLVFTGH